LDRILAGKGPLPVNIFFRIAPKTFILRCSKPLFFPVIEGNGEFNNTLNSFQDSDEHALLERLVAGDHQAFTRLYSIYLGNLYRYVFLFFPAKETAEEIVQDLFIKIWEKRESLAGVKSFKQYLFKAAKNHLLNALRNEQVKQKVLSHVQQQAEAAAPDTQNRVDYRASARAVENAVNRLPPKRKHIFRLSVQEGYSLDEIAAILRISKPVVKKQLYAAYDFVRDYLQKQGELGIYLIIILQALWQNRP
jgi:RNA polymerase sigma-70 factor (ECF subfamily)